MNRKEAFNELNRFSVTEEIMYKLRSMDFSFEITTDNDHYSNEAYFLSATKKISIVKHGRYGYNQFHDHEFFEIAFLFTGSCNHHFIVNEEEKVTTLNAGDLVIIPPGLKHCINIYDESLMVNILIHNKTFQSTFLSQLPFNTILSQFFSKALLSDDNQSYIVIQNSSSELGRWVLDLYIAEREDSPYSASICEHLLSIFFMEIIKNSDNTMVFSDKISERDKQVAAILLYIENNYSTTSLNDVSDHFHFSKSYLNRIFKEKVGTTILQYIKKLRMEGANRLLENQNLSVSEIGEMVGYNDTSYFIEEYKRFYGNTPKAGRSKTVQE